MPKLSFEIIPGADTETLSAHGYKTAREFAAAHSGWCAQGLHLAHSKDGKPYFSELPDFHFNISHSGEAVALAAHDSPIGVDIERLRIPELRIAQRHFTPDEQEYIGGDPTLFFEIWTKKEAYLKYTGEGLRRELTSFSVMKLPGMRFETQVRDGYMITMCTATTEI
ncbi:MAG: 4'-phosphopantetheinyl transferase superfamily protein [Oscillospiraceae bacterium]|jgi:4'-phosphopantetheinyl transferase|nr:4'-phosphopantetheinyl transferase superfamily protein [Oscillospiraceae bacterium]